MCTAVTYKTKDHYFGRNLDLDFSYNESVTVTPRNYPFKFREEGARETHFAMIGMAFVLEGYPLYYEATNEKGLSMAWLNFPENAVAMPRGCVRLEDGGLDLTVYSSCCNTDRGIYYYTTYDDFRIRSVDMQDTELDGDELSVYPVGKVL